eukprot:1959642-Pyramimonas_sp.AAC.1
MTDHARESATTPADHVLQWLRENVRGFAFWACRVNAQWHGLPQSRPRTHLSRSPPGPAHGSFIHGGCQE